jgi:hypothetical protein
MASRTLAENSQSFAGISLEQYRWREFLRIVMPLLIAKLSAANLDHCQQAKARFEGRLSSDCSAKSETSRSQQVQFPVIAK